MKCKECKKEVKRLEMYAGEIMCEACMNGKCKEDNKRNMETLNNFFKQL